MKVIVCGAAKSVSVLRGIWPVKAMMSRLLTVKRR